MKYIFIFCVVYTNSYAQLYPNTVGKYLDKNYVKARILTDNDKTWHLYGNSSPGYEVPVGKNTHAMYGNSIWIGGLDGGGQLHIAANTYKQIGMDFRPGPLDTANIAAFTVTTSIPYNKLWKVDCDEINAFVTAFNSGLVANGSYTIPDGILTYPGKGTANFQKNFAPFADVNNNGLYNPQTEGDYPLIKGHQQILSVYNDQNGIHSETQGLPMGVEIHERSYAYFEPNVNDTMQAINYTTFYHYTIYNRSNTNYTQVYVTDWADVDLGNYTDDFLGTNESNSFVYCYNGDSIDQNNGFIRGYGNKLPVLSHAILKTDCLTDGVDNNNDGTIDEPGERFLMDRTTFYHNNFGIAPPATTNPSTAVHFYNYMSGFWKDGSPFTFGGNAYGGTTLSPFIYTGDPETNFGWTEGSAGNAPGDRSVLLSSGPFNFPAKSKIEWGYAIVFSQDTTLVGNTITQFNERVVRDVKNVLYYDQTHSTPLCKPFVTVDVKKNELKKLNAMIYPNPADQVISVDLSENVKTAQVIVTDVFGRSVLQSKIIDGYRTTVDVSSLDRGIYFVEISSGNKKTTEKIIKN